MKRNYKRSKNYRKMFFLTHKGIFKSPNYYFCSYCGKIIHKKQVQVDHLISVHSVSKPGVGRLLMRLGRIRDINDASNLIPSCRYCNLQKGAKGGGWIIRGFIGRKPSYWIIRKTAFFLIFCFLIYVNLPSMIDSINMLF